MKKLFLLFAILLTGLTYGQRVSADLIKFKGGITTTIRDTFDVPAGEFWLIYNTTTAQLEIGDDTETWSAFSGGGGTAYTAGSGLILSGQTFSINTLDALFNTWDKDVTDDFSGNWSDLTNIPAGFADGVDNFNDVITSAEIQDGQVQNADIADATIEPDKIKVQNSPTLGYLLGYFNDTNSQWINPLALQIDWNNIQNLPAGFADGVDDDSGSSFDEAAAYNLTGAWDFDGFATFNDFRIDGPFGSSTWTFSQTTLNGLTIGVDGTPRFTFNANGSTLISTDVPTKQYIDDSIAALGNPNANSGQKVFTTIDGATTPTYTLSAGDFSPGGSDEGKLNFIIVQDTVEFSVPVITSTTKSIFVKGELNGKATFTATGAQLFWIADEDNYVNSFEIDNMNAAAITPVSATLYSVEGNVRGFNFDNTGPSAVGSLAASNIQSTSARLTWTHATDDTAVTYYELSNDGGSTYTNIGYVTQYDISGLTASTEYTPIIRGRDASANIGANASVTFTTAASFTLLTDSNANANLFNNGAGSNIDNDTGLYDSGIGDHFSPVNIQSQSAVVTTVNGYTHAHRVVSDGSQFSRVRPRFNNANTIGTDYEYDILYRMTDGGQYGAINIEGTSYTGLNATEWTLISGTYTASDTTLGIEVYASNNAAANAGEAIEWIVIIKEVESATATLDPSTTYTFFDFNDGTYPVTNVYDDNTATFVASRNNTNEKWVQLDLGTAKAIGYISLSSRSGFGTRLNGVNIQVSNDASSWTTDSTTGSAFTGSGVETNQFNLVDQSTQYRYIRIQLPTTGSNVNLDLSEFRVYTFN